MKKDLNRSVSYFILMHVEIVFILIACSDSILNILG